jgi:hypothetical protein
MAGPSPPPLLGNLLRRVQDDVSSTARVDAAGHTDRVYASHAQALTHLLRDAVLKRDWSRAAGACVSNQLPWHAALTRWCTALASAGLVVGPPVLGDPREFYRRSDAPVELLQLVRLHCTRGRWAGVLTRPVCARCSGDGGVRAAWHPVHASAGSCGQTSDA